ncbi:thermonuclease family protein [Nitrospirillum amazonense]|uniref:thermonuclease family protein n=1 Tax=Nitrospirillum amazonense TaxID=28077 RepID=UPI00119E6E24|nr:thermonuclease family protein [Nitrospirillum amazonense]
MKALTIILPVVVLLSVGVAVVFWPQHQAQPGGTATASDAGVLEIEGARHRLSGVSSPKPGDQCTDEQGRSWDCGRQAMQALQNLVAGKLIQCRLSETNRALEDCFVGGKSLSEMMVRQGWAVTCPAGQANYDAAERNARFLALGLWRGGVNPAVARGQCPR